MPPASCCHKATRKKGVTRPLRGASGSRAGDPHRTGLRLNHPEILELPGIGDIDVFRKQIAAVLERRPVAVVADDLAEIRLGESEHALKIQIVGIADAAL